METSILSPAYPLGPGKPRSPLGPGVSEVPSGPWGPRNPGNPGWPWSPEQIKHEMGFQTLCWFNGEKTASVLLFIICYFIENPGILLPRLHVVFPGPC